MNWYEFRGRIMEDLGIGKRRAMNLEMMFRQKYKGSKDAIQNLTKVRYSDSGRVTFKLKINNKDKMITI